MEYFVPSDYSEPRCSICIPSFDERNFREPFGWHSPSGSNGNVLPTCSWLPLVQSVFFSPEPRRPPATDTASPPVGTCSCHFAFVLTPLANFISTRSPPHPTSYRIPKIRTTTSRNSEPRRGSRKQDPDQAELAVRELRDEAEDAEQGRADGAAAGRGGGADRRHAGAGPDGGDVEGEAQGVAGEDLQQGVGVLGDQVLLQPDHHRLLQGVPVREPLLQAQHPSRQGRGVLGLPGLHHRRRHVREPGILHHRRIRDADEGALRIPRTRRRQDVMWIRCGHRRSAGVGALLQSRAGPRPGLLRRLLHAVPLRQGRRVLRPRRHPCLLELQLRRRRRRHQGGLAEPPGVPGAERDAGLRGGHVAVDDAHQEEAAVGARGLHGHLEAHQERHAQPQAAGPGRHHEPPLRRVHVRQGLHRPHERHHLALPVLPRPHGVRPGEVRTQPPLRRAGPLQPRTQEGRRAEANRRPAASRLAWIGATHDAICTFLPCHCHCLLPELMPILQFV